MSKKLFEEFKNFVIKSKKLYRNDFKIGLNDDTYEELRRYRDWSIYNDKVKFNNISVFLNENQTVNMKIFGNPPNKAVKKSFYLDGINRSS